jgi:ribose/xylose/arabinose/galactoside ABC-type transport system permease subunit
LLEDFKFFAGLQNAVSQSLFIARKFKRIGDKKAFCRNAGIRNYANRAETFSVSGGMAGVQKIIASLSF